MLVKRPNIEGFSSYYKLFALELNSRSLSVTSSESCRILIGSCGSFS